MANTTIKGKNYETTLITDSDSVIKLDKKGLVFYGGEISLDDPSTAANLGYGLVEDIATSPDIGGNTYKIDGRIVGLTGAVTTFGDDTKIVIGKTADVSAGLGIGIGAVLGGDLSGLSVGTVFAGGDNSKITIAKGADVGGLLGVAAFGANSSISNSGNVHTGLLGLLAGDIAFLLEGGAPAAEPSLAAKIVNNGSIESAIGIAGVVTGLTGDLTIENGHKGNITAGVIGIASFSLAGHANITNDGTIRVTMSVTIDPELGLPIPIGSAAILGLEGVEHVKNTGKIFGDIILGGGNDVMDNTGGSVKGVIFGGDGDDTLIVGKATDVLVELDAQGTDTVKSAFTYVLSDFVENLVLIGNKDIDGTGNDLDNSLIGNKGDNSLTGGAGIDTFAFGTKGGTDTITDFDTALDILDLSTWTGMTNSTVLGESLSEKNGDLLIKLGKDVLILNDHVIGDLDTANIVYALA